MDNEYLPKMTVSKVIEELSKVYTPLIQKNMDYSLIPSPFLWGAPGVGKSEGIGQLAEKIERETGKKVVVTDIRLLLFSPIDLRGVPVADETRTFTDWLKPRILDLDASEQVVNILFLDELSAAPQSVQAAAYQITLNRAIGEHRLPKNTIVMAAGNRVSDKSVAYRMPSALANRMMHFEIAVDFQSWSKWAITYGNVHPFILGYLSYDNSKLYMEERNLDEVAFPTPRSWMFLSNILHAIGENEDMGKLFGLISGCIGMGTAAEFQGWCRVYQYLPKPEEIFQGKAVECPKSPDVLYALIAVMTTYAVKKEEEGLGKGLSMEELENACAFCNKLPADYATCFFFNLMEIESLRLKMMRCVSFTSWRKLHSKVLNMAGK